MSIADLLGRDAELRVRPASVEGVQDTVRRAYENGHSLVPWGGGTGQDYGRPPAGCDVLLELGGLDALIAHEFADMTVTVEAGMPLGRLQEILGVHGQFLPLDPPDAEAATIGGILATNAFGPLRLGYGTARDWLIGLKVVDAAGRIVKGGGTVVKNVTGYDLPKLHIGALGTLGIIVEATFKVSPLPETRRTLVAQVRSGTDLSALTQRLWRDTQPVSLLLHEDAQGRFLVGLYHGSDTDTLAATTRAAELADASFVAQWQVFPEELVPEATAPFAQVRLSGPADQSVSLHDAIWDALQEVPSTLDTALGVGTVTLSWETETEAAYAGIQKALLLAKTRGVRYTLLHGPLSARTGAPETLWFPAPRAHVLHEQVKRALDPKQVLNPGRFVCGI